MSNRQSSSHKQQLIRHLPACFAVPLQAILSIHSRPAHLLASGPRTMEELAQWAQYHEEYSVYSFDVFDTLLRRRIDPPEEVKRLVAQHVSERLAMSGIQRDAAGILAERNRMERGLQQTARSRGLDAVATLDDIMASTLESIGVAGVLNWQEIVSYELALEKAATEPMPGVRDVLTCLRSKGKRLVAVSETYLSTAQMASILEHHDLLRFFDELYLSCDLGKSKLTGNLFRHLVEHEKGSIVHIGDHYTFDYRIPKKLGIEALWFRSHNEQRRRRELRKLSAGRNGLAYVNAIIGSADRSHSDLYRIGHDVLGPALTVFMHSVAERARKDSITRLFFVARDGFALKKIYQILQDGLYTGSCLPTAKYLCLSRLAVRRASLSVDGLTEADSAESFRYLAPRVKNVALSDILGSYGLEPDSFATFLGRHGLDARLPIVDPADERIRALVHDDDFQHLVKATSHTSRDLLREYLKSAGLMGAGNVALVDATSEALTQTLMRRVFSQDTEYPAVRGYYFTLLNLGVENTRFGRDISTARGIINDWRTNTESSQNAFRGFGIYVELFSHPNHGLTIGYRRVNGKTTPVFRMTSQESQYPLTSQGMAGILDYARKYAVCYRLHNHRCEDLVGDLRKDVIRWVRFPPKDHTEALKSLFVTSDWPRETKVPLVNQQTIGEPTRSLRRLLDALGRRFAGKQ